MPVCVLLHLDGKDAALKHPVAEAFLAKDWAVYAPDLRGTGAAKLPGDAIGGAPDHNSAEHAVWIGRPLLGQWVVDVRTVLDFIAAQPGLNPRRVVLVGLDQAGVVAVTTAGLLPDRLAGVAAVGSLASYVTTEAYAKDTRMGLLAPGILSAGDVAHLAALAAPRKFVVAGGISSGGKKLDAKQLENAFAFTRKVYRLHRADADLVVRAELAATAIVEQL
jgi:pimeloyl-ACP methyl ester carboxylesterase